mgnify:CR=1 FL=1
MHLNTTDMGDGVNITNNGSGLPTRITVTNAGIYNIQFSSQLGTIANETVDVRGIGFYSLGAHRKGLSKDKLNEYEKVFAELDWISKNKIRLVYNADSNFGMFKEHRDIVKYLTNLKRIASV